MGWDEASAAPIQPSWGEAKATLSAVGVIRAKISPCALARPRSSQHRGGARSDGKCPRVQLGRSAAGVVELRRKGLYSNSNEVSVPEVLIFFITYHTVAPHHVVRGPCDEACACSLGMSTLPTLPGDPEASSSGASSGPPSLVNARVLRDLKADHDIDTTVIEGSLAMIRGRYSISIEYGLHVSRSEQRPYSSDALSMCILVDALEAGLRFSLHPLIEECLRWWTISPSQVAPNSWCYFVVFLSECQGAEIIPTQDLFMACFRFCKSRGGYYLTARVDFQVSGVPSNNKGWKSCYIFVSGPVWGLRLDWSAHPIGNASPYLSEEEFVLVDRLKGIISSSCVIKEMAELWLVKAGLSPASMGMDLGLYVCPISTFQVIF
ncbi:hypothetical protein B296_00046168 [Ensete ventricosum]|uniref:Transposase (putative) gypsy type domain-containing protein n=1 Tax=Ensete ventricosum TaxID=4639 RepID=A0A426XBV4_ENSVE|nr:hypothetical protein B296_00046168 [Ensete ventricosum]